MNTRPTRLHAPLIALAIGLLAWLLLAVLVGVTFETPPRAPPAQSQAKEAVLASEGPLVGAL